MKFSQRIGVDSVDDVLQTEGMNEALRNSLWNVLDLHFWSRPGFQMAPYGSAGQIDEFSRNLWFNYFKKRMDSIPSYPYQILNQIREYFYRSEWYEIYNFIEFVFQSYKFTRFAKDLNSILERELAGFRLVDGYFIQVTDEAEKQAIEKALESGPYTGVRTHLHQALQHLANRENPDYRNSIKESISAVESLACELSGNPKATLGDALKTLEKEGKLHAALKNGFSAIYGYTSDAGGIRHAMLDVVEVDATDAKYFLVSCSAFVNYLMAKHSKAQ